VSRGTRGWFKGNEQRGPHPRDCEIAAHEARKRDAGRQKCLKNLADLQNKFAEQNARFTAETGIEVKNPITDQQLTDLAAAFRRQREERAASVGLPQGQNAPP
jgi:hypothetical protein